jgi:tRNA(adenine34) deaminase
MALALALADEAAAAGEVPVGAIVVADGKVVGRGRNCREHDQDPLGHAEIVAIRDAARALGTWRFPRSTLYVTLEPCAMCAGAILAARIDRVVFGCRDAKSGAVRSLFTLLEDPRQSVQAQVIEGIMEKECRQRLTAFFDDLRSQKRREEPGREP